MCQWKFPDPVIIDVCSGAEFPIWDNRSSLGRIIGKRQAKYEKVEKNNRSLMIICDDYDCYYIEVVVRIVKLYHSI